MEEGKITLIEHFITSLSLNKHFKGSANPIFCIQQSDILNKIIIEILKRILYYMQ